jgi:hypothetical protein
MKNRLTILVFLCFLVTSSFAQDYKGLWVGYLTGKGPNTNYILDVKTQEGNVITGRAYVYSQYYLVHQGMLDFIGDIGKNGLKITELSIMKSIVTFRNNVLCIKFDDLKYSNKNNISTLTGKWDGSELQDLEYTPGDVYLKKVSPDMQEEINSIPEYIKKEMSDNKSAATTFHGTDLKKPLIINVTNRFLTLEIKDYLRQDNDTISIYYNRNLLISRLGITKQSFIYPVKIERVSGLNEIILFANNLGEVPPNTSQLIIRDGKTAQRVDIESTKQTSAVIYLRYTPPEKGL